MSVSGCMMTAVMCVCGLGTWVRRMCVGVHVCGCLGWWARGDDFMFAVVMICITDFFFSAVIPVHS